MTDFSTRMMKGAAAGLIAVGGAACQPALEPYPSSPPALHVNEDLLSGGHAFEQSAMAITNAINGKQPPNKQDISNAIIAARGDAEHAGKQQAAVVAFSASRDLAVVVHPGDNNLAVYMVNPISEGRAELGSAVLYATGGNEPEAPSQVEKLALQKTAPAKPHHGK